MVNYTFYSTKPAGKIQVGDILKTEKGKQTKITDLYRHQGETVFVTDRFGLVFENEIEVKNHKYVFPDERCRVAYPA